MPASDVLLVTWAAQTHCEQGRTCFEDKWSQFTCTANSCHAALCFNSLFAVAEIGFECFFFLLKNDQFSSQNNIFSVHKFRTKDSFGFARTEET